MESDILMEFESYNICDRIAFEVKFLRQNKKNPLKCLRFLGFFGSFSFPPNGIFLYHFSNLGGGGATRKT
jgi:hypothetical protein